MFFQYALGLLYYAQNYFNITSMLDRDGISKRSGANVYSLAFIISTQSNTYPHDSCTQNYQKNLYYKQLL